MIAAALAAFVYMRKRTDLSPTERRDFVLRMGLVGAFVVLLACLLLSMLGTATILLAEFSRNHPTIFTVLAIATGGALFLLRRKSLFLYGALECFIAIIGLISAPSIEKIDLATWFNQVGGWGFLLMGFIYLLVTGLDDMEKGLKLSRAAEGEGSGPRA